MVKRGFSLFEILLVLFVMSMLVIGGIQYAQLQKAKNAARELGQRLYQYGVAVAEYARQNPDKLPVGSHEVYGIEWLKNKINPETCTTPDLTDPNTCEMFLGKDYNLNFQFIMIGNLDGAPDLADDKLYTKLTHQSTGEVVVDLVELGTVYRYGKAASGNQYEIDLSLPGDAATAANEYTKEYGDARLIYTVEGYTPDSDVKDIHVVGVPNVSLPNVDAGYLRTDGTNDMDGNIQFSTTGDGIVFKNGNKINSMVVKSMTQEGYDLGQGEADTSSPPTTTYGDFYASTAGGTNKKYRHLNGYNVNNSICFLTGVQNLLAEGDICRVVPTSVAQGNIKKGDWMIYVQKMGSQGRSACYARCLVFNQ